MQLTTKGRYAVTAMLDLSIHGSELLVGSRSCDSSNTPDLRKNPVRLAEISKRQGISLSYLEQLFSKLRRAQLVDSIKGPGGGYVLTRESSHISVSQVIQAVDEKMDVTACGGEGNCFQGEQCMTHQLWEDLSQQLSYFLGSISLGSLVEKHHQRQAHQTSKSMIDLHQIEDNLN